MHTGPKVSALMTRLQKTPDSTGHQSSSRWTPSAQQLLTDDIAVVAISRISDSSALPVIAMGWASSGRNDASCCRRDVVPCPFDALNPWVARIGTF
jgi:hypothetical protein